MAKLGINWAAYDLERALRMIKTAHDAAIEALTSKASGVYAEIAALEEAMEEGTGPSIEADDDGVPIDDPRDYLLYDSELIEEAVNDLRKSTMISLFHGWERVVRNWTKLTARSDQLTTVIAALDDKGIKVTPEVRQLGLLVNALKHNAEDKTKALFEVRPDLFAKGYDPEKDFTAEWYDSVQLSRQHVDAFFAAVIASGPTHSHPG